MLGERVQGLHSLPQSSLPLLGQRPSPPGASPACGRPAAASGSRVRVPPRGGVGGDCSETPAPHPLHRRPRSKARHPGPVPLPLSLHRGAPGEPGEQTQQIAELRSAEPAPSALGPRARPAARTPALRARLGRPFRCSSQARGRASGSGSRAPAGPLPSRGQPQEATRRAVRRRTGLRARARGTLEPPRSRQFPARPFAAGGCG